MEKKGKKKVYVVRLIVYTGIFGSMIFKYFCSFYVRLFSMMVFFVVCGFVVHVVWITKKETFWETNWIANRLTPRGAALAAGSHRRILAPFLLSVCLSICGV